MFPSHLRVMHIIRTENLFECTLQFIKSCMLPFVEHYTRYIIWIIWFDVDQLHLPANDLFSTAMAHDVRRIWICLHSNIFAWWKKNWRFVAHFRTVNTLNISLWLATQLNSLLLLCASQHLVLLFGFLRCIKQQTLQRFDWNRVLLQRCIYEHWMEQCALPKTIIRLSCTHTHMSICKHSIHVYVVCTALVNWDRPYKQCTPIEAALCMYATTFTLLAL